LIWLNDISNCSPYKRPLQEKLWLSATIALWLYASMLGGMESSQQDRAPQEADKFIVRLPEGMRDILKARAASNNRSMNAEIVAILGAAIGDESSLGAASVETLLKAIADRMGAAVQIHVAGAAPSSDAKKTRAAARKLAAISDAKRVTSRK
jgi:plasmid stability protein